MKSVIVIIVFLSFLIACNEPKEELKIDSNIEFYKFFDPFAFKGIKKIDSASNDFPLYKLYFDSLKNIVKITEFTSSETKVESKVRYFVNEKMLLDSSDGAFQDQVTMMYRFFFDKKVVSIYNFLYTKSGRIHTKFLNIYTPTKAVEYVFFGDGIINEPNIDSSYLKKIALITPENVLSNNFHFDTTFIESKSINYISNTKNEIVVKTLFTNKDTVVSQTFNYNNKKYDNFWVGKYNFFDSIAGKLYYDKHYKNRYQ